jgi:hypothetical protein
LVSPLLVGAAGVCLIAGVALLQVRALALTPSARHPGLVGVLAKHLLLPLPCLVAVAHPRRLVPLVVGVLVDCLRAGLGDRVAGLLPVTALVLRASLASVGGAILLQQPLAALIG